MRIIYQLWATVGEYTDHATGKKAKRQVPVGVVFQSEGGAMSARIDTIPVSPGWGGFLAFRRPPSADAQPAALPPGQRLPKGMPPAPPPTSDHDEDEIPF